MSSLAKARLNRMHDVMAGYVQRGEMPGLVTLVSRHGETHIDAFGTLSFGGAPMQRETSFRVASMTKPVAAIAD
jgi:CubicO group peptidase (beta-lactamase class C family)